MIKAISIKHFGIHESREFELSPGVTLLIGGNGTGKTTLVQAIVWAIWGKTLRPFELDAGTEVRLQLPEARLAVDGDPKAPPVWNLTRRITSRGESVDLLGSFTNSNKTRAAEALESLFGLWEAWKRTLYVTGKTVSRFATGTPSDKFNHLVAITGADMFDTAAEQLKVHLDEFDNGPFRTATNDANTASSALGVERNNLNKHRATAPRSELLAPVEELQARFDEITAQLVEAEATVTTTVAAYLAASEAMKLAELRMRTAEKQHMGTTRGTCATCNQPVPLPGDAELQQTYVQLRQEYEARWSACRQAESTWNAATGYKYTLHRKLDPVTKELNNATNAAWQLARIEKDTIAHVQELLAAKVQTKEAVEFVDALQVQRGRILAARTVITNARKRHLMGYVTRIESFANYYLTATGSKLRVQLSFDKNKLNIGVSGVGGKDYESISSGEQRRVDICLILAMGQAAAETGTVPSTTPLVIDEAFDTLDADGVEALINLACEIAKTRQVILISHADPAVPVDPGVWKINL